MITFLEHLNESSALNPIKEDLYVFLRREKIMGYDKDILSILDEEPSENVIDDIKDSFKDEDNISISKEEIASMDLRSMLSRFLEWNGIKGYTEAIISITGKSKSEIYKDKDLLVWRDKYYYYRPKDGDSSIWAWDNPETEGIPKLIKTEEIYNTSTYYNKDYYKSVEKVYKD